MEKKEVTKKQMKTMLHIRIWVSGLIATVVFVGLMYMLEDDYVLIEGIVHFATFFGIWVILHYLFLRKTFKSIDETE